MRLIPQPTDDNISGLAWHTRAIIALAIAFVVVGALIRLAAHATPLATVREWEIMMGA